MAFLEMVQHKEHAELDSFVNPMEHVNWDATLMEDLETELREVVVMTDNYVKQMEHALQVCIISISVQYYTQ